MERRTELRTHALQVVLLLAAVLLGVSDNKTVPGGPFISIVHEVIPVVLCFLVSARFVRNWRTSRWSQRVYGALFTLLATFLTGTILKFVISFWMSPYSRGRLIAIW